MKKAIYKYSFDLKDRQTIVMPEGAEILSVQTQHEVPCLWAMVAPENKTEIRLFEVFATGQIIPCDMGVKRKYIGTFQVQGGHLVFHLFERLT